MSRHAFNWGFSELSRSTLGGLRRVSSDLPIEFLTRPVDRINFHLNLDRTQVVNYAQWRSGEAIAAAYDAPFPDESYKAGARAFPSLLMVEPEMEGVEESRAAELFWSNDWSGQSFMAIGAADKSLGLPAMQALRAKIRGCPEPMIFAEVGHCVQEHGQAVARAALQAFGDLR